ncbi:hypothetical protein AB4Z14_21935 [Terrabacter sp. 2TAF16]|uniref:hypothetical protein n=1 Tax=Terrabacter sp. 2TAF16 TaxID=3233008 RepID=UPI003F9CD89D
MTDDETLPWASLDDRGRQQLTLAQVAGRLDHRLHLPGIGIPELKAGCQLAVDHHLAAVTCRTEHVGVAAAHLAGTGVPVVTAIGFSDPRSAPVNEAAYVEEAQILADSGATELGVIASAARLAAGAEPSFLGLVERLLKMQDNHGFRLRVHLDTAGLADEQILTTCRQLAAAGVRMVGCGTWQGHRAGFRQVVLMREALGAGVLLKWAALVTSLHMMLLGIAEGVDRFNAEVTPVLPRSRETGEPGPAAGAPRRAGLLTCSKRRVAACGPTGQPGKCRCKHFQDVEKGASPSCSLYGFHGSGSHAGSRTNHTVMPTASSSEPHLLDRALTICSPRP